MSNKAFKPENTFWLVTIELVTEDETTGKLKKQKEVHLVDGVNVGDVEKKVADEMEGEMNDWKVISVQESKISTVY